MNSNQLPGSSTARAIGAISSGFQNQPIGRNAYISSKTKNLPRNITFTPKTHSTPALGQAYLAQINALKNKDPRYPLQVFESGSDISIDKLEAEFQTLLQMHHDEAFWESLSEDEKITIEKYKLALMKSTQNHLKKRKKITAVVSTKPAEKTIANLSWTKWLMYGVLFLLDLIPMIWGNYVGIIELLAFVPGFTEAAIAGVSIAASIVEIVLYYAMMSPLLKEALSIPVNETTEPEMEIYYKQYTTLENINSLMLDKNEMNSTEYQHCMNLIKLFNDSMSDLKEYTLYLRKTKADLRAKELGNKALILIDDQLYFVRNEKLLLNIDGSPLTTKISLTADELSLLHHHAKNDKVKVKETMDNEELLCRIRDQGLAQVGLSNKPKIEKFVESPFKIGLRWALSAVSLALNIGGGYAFALFLLGTTVATMALLSTPLGWGLLAALIIGQIALQLIVRNDALFDMLNPGAHRYMEIRKKINHQESQHEKFNDQLALKLESFKDETTEALKRDPHIDMPTNFSALNFHRLHQPLKPLAPLPVITDEPADSLTVKTAFSV